MDTLTLIFFAVNLIFIVTNVYGYLLNRFFVPDIYKKDAAELFPARRSVAQFYLLQLFEVPYLFMPGRPEALFYVNGTGLLVFSSFILVIVRKYFFLQTSSLRKRLLFLMPMWASWVALVIPLIQPAVYTPRYQWTMTTIILVLFVVYMFHLDRFRKQLMDKVREVDEGEYSNEDDFPVTFARSIRWLLPRDSPRAVPSRRSSSVSRALRRRNICARKNNLLIISGFILRQLTQNKAILTQDKAFLTHNKGQVGVFLEICLRKQSKKS